MFANLWKSIPHSPFVKKRGIRVLALLFLCIPAISFAQTQDSLQEFGYLASAFINIFTFLALLVLRLTGDLIGTDFITGDEAWNTLLPMWQTIRNLTNIAFVGMLVYLAFTNLIANVAGDGAGNWAWQIKDKLPRIIIALIVINFSGLAFRVAIDAVHMGSMAIFSIADDQLQAQSADSTFRILNGSKWRRVKTSWDDIETIYMEPPYDTVPKYIKLEPGRDNYDEKWEDKSCKNELEDYLIAHPGEYEEGAFLDRTDGAGRQKLWTGARKYDRDNGYIPDPDTTLICGSFAEQINQQFCPKGVEDGLCFFRMKVENYSINDMIQPKNATAQNLFMAFGTVFMRLEQLPSLAANIDNILQVIDNTLFSAILSLAYVVALVSLLITLIVRVLVLWLAIVFSPALIGASVMGIGGGGGDIASKLTTYLLVPIKIAAAFAISFVMLSGLVEFRPEGSLDMFEFGPALSGLAVDEYAIMWQIATVAIFWMTAKWALKDTYESQITENIFKGAETVGEYLAKSATIENQMFTVKGSQGQEHDLSLAGLLRAPTEIAQRRMNRFKYGDATDFYQSFVPGEGDLDKFRKSYTRTTEELASATNTLFANMRESGIKRNSKLFYKNLMGNIQDLEKSGQVSEANRIRNIIKNKYEGKILDAAAMAEIVAIINPSYATNNEIDSNTYAGTSGGSQQDQNANSNHSNNVVAATAVTDASGQVKPVVEVDAQNNENLVINKEGGTPVQLSNANYFGSAQFINKDNKDFREQRLGAALDQVEPGKTAAEKTALASKFDEIFFDPSNTNKTPDELYDKIRLATTSPVVRELFRWMLLNRQETKEATTGVSNIRTSFMPTPNTSGTIDTPPPPVTPTK